MKKFKLLLLCVCFSGFLIGCAEDFTDDIDDLKNRVTNLEETCRKLNNDISGIQAVVDAVAKRDYITQIQELPDQGGYKFTFAQKGDITISGGTGGKDAPVVGVKKDDDNIYYWTLTTNGREEWLLADGNKMPVSGTKGDAPVMGVDADGYWTVDSGSGAKRVLNASGDPVKATGEKGDSFFTSVDVTTYEDKVVFVLANGSTFEVPRIPDSTLSFVDKSDLAIYYGANVELEIQTKDLKSATVAAPQGWVASVNLTKKTVTLKAPSQTDKTAELSGAVSVIAVTDKGQTATTTKNVEITETFRTVAEINEIVKTLVTPNLSDATPLNLNFIVSEAVSAYDGFEVPAAFNNKNVLSITLTYMEGVTTSLTVGSYGCKYNGTVNVVLPAGKTVANGMMQLQEGQLNLSGKGTYSAVSVKTGDICNIKEDATVTTLKVMEGSVAVYGTVSNIEVEQSATALDIMVLGTLENETIKDDGNIATLLKPRKVTPSSSKWISEVLEYRPAPGQNMNLAWSLPANVAALVGGRASTGVTLGTFGGSVTFKFDHSVINYDGVDFVIHGNAFSTSNEPGAVMVAYDRNGNGKPDDDEWYELKGDSYDKSEKGYEMTFQKPDDTTVKSPIKWTDNKGGSGEFPTGFYNRTYWPLMLEGETLTYKGNKIVYPGSTSDPNAAGNGYADNYTPDYIQVVNNDNDTKNGNKFDISNAVDADGNPVKLLAVDFIRVYNPVYAIAGMFGEVSTEVCGALSLSVNRP